MQSKKKDPLHIDMEGARDFILKRVRSVVVGPVGPDNEELGCSPNDLYLSGILYPRQDAMGLAEDDGAAAAEDSSEAESVAPPRNSFKPSSLGLTFTVRNGVGFKVSTGTSARYVKAEAAAGPAKWMRRPLGIVLRLTSGDKAASVSYPDKGVRVHVVARATDVFTTYTLSLVNESTVDSTADYPATLLYQSQLLVECDEPAFLSRQASVVGGADEAAVNEMLYRHRKEFAVGHGVAALWNDDAPAQVSRIWTDWMPVQVVESTSVDGHASLRDFLAEHPHAFSAEWLAGAKREEIVPALKAFLVSYGDWIAKVESRYAASAPGHETAAIAQVEQCRRALRRMEAGLAALSDKSAWEAFQAANLAMDMQSRFMSKGALARPMVWRPFQLGFLLLSIDSIVRPESPSRNEMDLLWFPTGGGKTEAYLLLAAFAIFHKRLTSSSRKEHGGVDVLMRYTLRLLTVQQYQRAASVMVACDRIRSADVSKWGVAPITAGLLVGGETTPNSLAEAAASLAAPSPKSTPCILQACPCCGSALPRGAYVLDETNKALFARCMNQRCDVSRTAGVPSLTVDEVIFAHPPSLLLGTIDKFAQLPRNARIGELLRMDGVPPDLIIQDELHLISGPLGSIAGLYEVLVDQLCSSGDVRPKVVGSSATVGGAKRQVRALFDREVMQFPPSGLDSDDSFFAVRDADAPNRMYVGLCNAGRSPKFALQFVQAAIMQAAELAKAKGVARDAAIDPYWTTLIYYNTIRELGAGLTMSSDDVPMAMRTFARQMDQGAAPARSIRTVPLELSSNVKSSDIPVRIKQLGKPLGGPVLEPPVDIVLASNIISVGLDIPRLGVMVMNQQPKTMSEYIQATSRVGRGIPGLIFTLHNVSRPRDASHFEHFKYIHMTLYKGVEANSVTPWASRARDKCLAPVFAAMVRYLLPSMSKDDDAIRFSAIPDDQLAALVEAVAGRAQSSGRFSYGNDESVKGLRVELASFINKWKGLSASAENGGYKLVYWRTSPTTRAAVIRSAEEAAVILDETPAPNSMRDVEPTTAYFRNQ